MRYARDDTFLHRADARAKLGTVVVISLALTWASPVAVVAVGAVVAGAAWTANVGAAGFVRELRFVLFVVAVGTVATAVSHPDGVETGAAVGAVAGGRFVVIIALAYVVAKTTRTTDVRLAVESVLRPVPRVNETDWGTMFAAAARFYPLVLDEAGRVREARAARLGDEQRWYTRVRSSAYALLTRSFRRADTLALAMAARGYTGERTSMRRLVWTRDDTTLTVAAVVVAVGAYAA